MAQHGVPSNPAPGSVRSPRVHANGSCVGRVAAFAAHAPILPLNVGSATEVCAAPGGRTLSAVPAPARRGFRIPGPSRAMVLMPLDWGLVGS